VCEPEFQGWERGIPNALPAVENTQNAGQSFKVVVDKMKKLKRVKSTNANTSPNLGDVLTLTLHAGVCTICA
jgi:hypothetical protein